MRNEEFCPREVSRDNRKVKNSKTEKRRKNTKARSQRNEKERYYKKLKEKKILQRFSDQEDRDFIEKERPSEHQRNVYPNPKITKIRRQSSR